METKDLDFKEFNHIKYDEIKKKYSNETNPVKFTLDEFKSILSLIFSVKFNVDYYSPGVRNWMKKNPKYEKHKMQILNEKFPIINITSKFGRQIIENFEGENLEEFKIFSERSYVVSEIIDTKKASELNIFVENQLVKYMLYCNFQYGKFFLNNWENYFSDLIENLEEKKIKKIKNILKDKDFYKKIEFLLIKEDPNLEETELILLTCLLKEMLCKTENKTTSDHYVFAAFLIKGRLHSINERTDVLKLIVKNVINNNQ